MRIFAILAILAATTLAAFATGGVPAPKQYDRPYNGKLTIQRLDILQIRRICGGLANACAIVGKGRCTVIIGQQDNWITRRALAHEIAHCNGWRH